MTAVGGLARYRCVAAGAGLLFLAGAVSGCGGSSDTAASDGATSVAETDATTTTIAFSTTTAAPDASETTATTLPEGGLPDASEAQHTAPGDGTGTALLKTVRVGNNEGFERIVFEFAGESMPGYRIQWVDGPITADGSGEVVEVEGDALLEIVMDPASGVDLSAPQLTIVYQGPDRIPVEGQTELITDLVRTGDFEAVLSWAAGTTERVPFRVLALREPTRIVIDLEDP